MTMILESGGWYVDLGWMQVTSSEVLWVYMKGERKKRCERKQETSCAFVLACFPPRVVTFKGKVVVI